MKSDGVCTVGSELSQLGDIQQTEHVIVGLGPRVVSGRFERDLDPDSGNDGRRIGAGPCNDVIANGSKRDQLNVHRLHGK